MHWPARPPNRCETALIRDGMFLHRLLATSAAARRAGVGESTVIAPSKAPSFKAGKTLRDAVRGWVGTARTLAPMGRDSARGRS